VSVECRQPFIEVPGGPFEVEGYTWTCLHELGTDLVKNRHLHFLSCLTGMYLGYELVATYGAKDFVGYSEDFEYGVIIPAHIDLEKCTGCGACLDACPCRAIYLTEIDGKTKAKINPDVCPCKLCPWPDATPPCAPACPHNAIIIEYEPEAGEPPSDWKDYYSAIHSDVAGEEAIILNAATVREGVEAMRRRFQEYIDKYAVGEWKDRPIAMWARQMLEHDLNCLVTYGNLDWKPYSGETKPTRLEMLARFISTFSMTFGLLGFLIPYRAE
jgi:ferredoxin